MGQLLNPFPPVTSFVCGAVPCTFYSNLQPGSVFSSLSLLGVLHRNCVALGCPLLAELRFFCSHTQLLNFSPHQVLTQGLVRFIGILPEACRPDPERGLRALPAP